jgi:hypothetical protein
MTGQVTLPDRVGEYVRNDDRTQYDFELAAWQHEARLDVVLIEAQDRPWGDTGYHTLAFEGEAEGPVYDELLADDTDLTSAQTAARNYMEKHSDG